MTQFIQPTVLTQSCSVCGTSTTHGCNNCKQTFYCSLEHQKVHWPVHRKECKPQLKSAMKNSQQKDEQEDHNQKALNDESKDTQEKSRQQISPGREKKRDIDDPKKQGDILESFRDAIDRTNNYVTPKRSRSSQRVKVLKQDKALTQEQISQQIIFDHAQLRIQVVKTLAANELDDAIAYGKKLIQISKKLNESSQKSQFYEYVADQLMVSKVYIQKDDLVKSRELLLIARQQLMDFISEASIYKTLKQNQNHTRQQEINHQEDVKKVCSLLQLMASLFYACGDFKNCEQLYVEYVKIIENLNGQDSIVTSDGYFLVGVFYLQHKRYIQSLACFKRALNIRTFKNSEGKSEPIADCWYNIGVIYKQTGKKMKAIDMIQKALSIRREIIGDVSLQVSMCLETLGKIYMQENDFKSSLTKFSECFYIRRRLLNNSEHVDLVRISLLILNLYQTVKNKMFENYGGLKMQPVLRNVVEKIQTTILDNNLKRYMSEDPDVLYIEAQSNQVNHSSQQRYDQLQTEQDQQDDRKLTRIKQQNPQNMNSSYSQSTSNQRGQPQNQEGSSLFTKKIPTIQNIGAQILRTQDDEFDLSPQQNIIDDDRVNIQQFFKIRRELLQTLSIDQMISLEELCKDLKRCLVLNSQFDLKRNISSSAFIQSLSSIQFAIIYDDNPGKIERSNRGKSVTQEIFSTKGNKNLSPPQKNLTPPPKIQKSQRSDQIYLSGNEDEENPLNSMKYRQPTQILLPQKSQHQTSFKKEKDTEQYQNSIKRDKSMEQTQMKYIYSEEASYQSEIPDQDQDPENYHSKIPQNKQKIQGKIRPISLLK